MPGTAPPMRDIIFWNLPIFFIILLHLGEFVEHGVHFGQRSRRCLGDADAAFGVENLRTAPFLRCHRANHSSIRRNSFSCFDKSPLLFQHLGAAGQHAHDAFQRTEFFHLAQLLEKILESKLALAHFFFELFGIIDIDRFGGFSTRLTTSPMPRIREAMRSG